MDEDTQNDSSFPLVIKMAGLVIPVHATAMDWLCVVGALELALRHPEFIAGPACDYCTQFCNQLREKLVAEGFLAREAADRVIREQAEEVEKSRKMGIII